MTGRQPLLTLARGVARSARYIQVMFPPAVLVPIGIVQFFSVYLALEAIAGLVPLRIGGRALLGAGATVLWTLLIRIDDDLTDTEHDARMAAAGDPRYRTRPTVTGAITRRELRALQAGTLGLFLGANLVLGGWAMRFASVAGYGLTWLGFRWFFIGALNREAPPLAYLVRKILTVLFGLYALAVFTDDFGGAMTWWTVPLLLAPCAGVAAWETARKIRLPEDETDYATYSKAFGWRAAALLPACFVALSVACLLPVSEAAGLGAGYAAALLAAAGVAVGACLRFRLRPTRGRARLGGLAQLYGVVAHGGLAVALLVRYGLAGPC
jgi:4-hydroxybenzoate polyprenyltransferase